MRQRLDLAAITGNRVLDADQKPLGRVRELIIDGSGDRIAFATLVLDEIDCGRPLEVVVPWSQFRMTGAGDRLRLDISLDVLRSVAVRRLTSIR